MTAIGGYIDSLTRFIKEQSCSFPTVKEKPELKGTWPRDWDKYYENKQVVYKHFNHRNGYLGIEPTQNTFLKDSEGKFWIASSTSVDQFDPGALKKHAEKFSIARFQTQFESFVERAWEQAQSNGLLQLDGNLSKR